MNRIEVLVKVRKTILKSINDLSLNEVNEIPAGFNNNIAWNLGNILVSQQSVLYRCSGLPVKLDEKYFPLYKGGTKPEADLTTEELDTLKSLFEEQTNIMESDFSQGVFKEYREWNHGMTGIDIDSIDTAIQFLTFHESLHLGYIMALKKAIS